MGLDSYADILAYVLTRAGEIDAGGTVTDSPFHGLMDELIAQAHRDLVTRHPWLDLLTTAAFVTTDDVTTLTLTVASAGASVTGTLSSAPTSSFTGRKVKPSGKTWFARITAHTANDTSITLDAAPETVAAGTACVIYQDEYDLASDLGIFADGLWDQAGDFVPLDSLETLAATYRDPQSSGARTAEAFARLTRRKIRLAPYPNAVRRYEYSYLAELSDPSGSSDLTLPAYLRPILAEGVLALLYQMKLDRRQSEAQQRYEVGIERAIAYETKRRTGYGMLSQMSRQGGYADRRRTF